ncbi:MAG: TRAP transporter TatT component family protein [Acidobacteriia bacterium]|nr:TRAP transporter TatT component family protein [Terriglobia bacterium]
MIHKWMAGRCLVVVAIVAISAGCSIKKIAVNKLGNALASSGSTFEEDEDPDLVAAAIPFGLKLYESLLAESPRHDGLLLAACSGFTEYSYAFVDARVDEAKEESLARADAMRERARKLYLRANRYGMRGLEARHPGFAAALDNDAAAALKRTDRRDAALLYWTAASRGLAISLSKDNPDLIAELPLVEMIVRRVSELDEAFNDGAVPEFLITLEAAHRGEKSDEELQKSLRGHFERALALSHGKRAGTYVSFAENALIPAQNAAAFKDVLEKALAVDVDAAPDNRLANLVAQRRARWLLNHVHDLILERAPAPAGPGQTD